DEIPGLYRMIKEEGYDLVSGWKKKRHDPITKTIPSKFFNRITRWMSGIQLNDFNCGLKSYRSDVVHNIEVYGEMHRYIPVIAKWAGFTKIGEKVVQHRARQYGVSKFGLERFVRGFLDLLSITFVGRFSKRPMHFFGSYGTIFILLGFVVLTYLAVLKFVYSVYNMTDRPLFFFGILCFIFGTQMFMTGFLAEMVSRNAPNRNQYLVETEIDAQSTVEKS
ncbi:MAG: glycosyltransferase, partial [Bacteroidota bacterium]